MIIGLTGGIASGKSAVSRKLQSLGAEIIDGDKIAREMTEPGAAGFSPVIGAFGAGVLDRDGRINRRRLGGIVFADKDKLFALNAILHPLIKDELILRAVRSKADIVVLDVPLLIECGWQNLPDEVWLVTASEQTRIRRIMARDGLCIAEAEARIASQMRDEEKTKYADVIINNEGSIAALDERVTRLFYGAKERKDKKEKKKEQA